MADIEYQDEDGLKQIAQTLTFTGRVEQINDFTTSSTSGSGGVTETTYDGQTFRSTTTPVRISTTHTRNLDFFLIAQNGKEINIKLKGWDNVAIRKGHIITAVWLKNNDKYSPYCIIVNKSLGKYWSNFRKLNSFLGEQKFIEKEQRGMRNKTFKAFIFSYILTYILIFSYTEKDLGFSETIKLYVKNLPETLGGGLIGAIPLTIIFFILLLKYIKFFGLKNWYKMLDDVHRQLQNYAKSLF